MKTWSVNNNDAYQYSHPYTNELEGLDYDLNGNTFDSKN